MTDHTELLVELGAPTMGDYKLHNKAAQAIRALQTQHEDLVTRNAFLRERPDLPVDRIPVYERMREQIDELEEQVKYKQAQYDSMFRTMVEAGEKIIRLEARIAELEGAES